MLRLTTPSRLHLGIFPPSSSTSRYGGVGIALEHPGYSITAAPSSTFSVSGPQAARLKITVERYCAAVDTPVPSESFVIEAAIPPHVGLGSGTQLALAAGRLVDRLCGKLHSVSQTARVLGRGTRSLVGTRLFEHGGLVYDPGSAGDLQRHPIPADWRFVLVSADGEAGPAGTREKHLFAKLSQSEHLNLRGHTLVEGELLPALADSDLASFGEAVSHLDEVVADAFGSLQGGRFYHEELNFIADVLSKAGCVGVGQSSWGPTMYGIVEEKREDAVLREVSQTLSQDHRGADVWAASASNTGATVKEAS